MKNRKRRDVFSSMLGEFAVLLPDATKAFYELVVDPEGERSGPLDQLQQIESEANTRYAKLLRKAAQTFLTPFDRDDMYRLLERLDDAIDELEQAGAFIVTLSASGLPAGLTTNAELLRDMSAVLVDAVDSLKKPKKVADHLEAYYEAKSRMDLNYRSMLIEVLHPGNDPIVAVQTATILSSFDDAVSDLDRFARALGAIAIKEL